MEKETGLLSGISGETGRSGEGRVVMEAGYQGCVSDGVADGYGKVGGVGYQGFAGLAGMARSFYLT